MSHFLHDLRVVVMMMMMMMMMMQETKNTVKHWSPMNMVINIRVS